MSYRKTIYAHASGTGPDMTDDEFEMTVAEWQTSFPALAAKVRGLQSDRDGAQEVALKNFSEPTEPGWHKLDYEDQCDLVYGRLRRLVSEKPELLEHLSGLSAVDLGIDGLGLSGEQVAMVIEQLKGEKTSASTDAIAPSVKTDDDPNADQEPDGDPPRDGITPTTSDEQPPAAGAGM